MTTSQQNTDHNLPGDLSNDDLIGMYETMVLSRNLDERVWLLNRQGKAAIAASAQGHEASQIGTVKALDLSKDHFLIYYRQFTVMLGVGTTPTELLSGFLAKQSEPMSGARQFPLHGAHPRVDLFSFSNVVATQLPHAVGVALADKMNGSDAVTIVFFGDGAASQGDTHEAMNFAGIHGLPVIFMCENNRYAISVPMHKQMPIDSIASRASSYGFPGVSVDGTNMIAVYEAVSAAAERARSAGGPTLIESNVERLLPHTTDDDHTRYRPEDDIAGMRNKDPLDVTRAMLIDRGILNAEQCDDMQRDALATVNAVTDEVDAWPYPQVETMFDHLFAEGSRS